MKVRVRNTAYLVFFVVASLSMGCGRTYERNKDSGKPVITVSIEPQRNLLESIVGDDFDVVTILDRGADPETFEPSMSRRVAVDRSVAFMPVGAFRFERSLMESAATKLKVYDTSEGIDPIFGTHAHSDDGHCMQDEDPHVWTSVKNARLMAANMTEALKDINPDRADVYAARFDSLCSELDSLDVAISSRLESAPSRSFAVWHPSLSYFARDYGLRQVAVGQENKEISPMRMREVLDEAARADVRVFFYQKEFDSRQAEMMSGRIGARLVPIDPLSYDWQSQLKSIADEIAGR